MKRSRVRRERMRATVAAIARHQTKHGYSPSVRGVAGGHRALLHLGGGALAPHLRAGGLIVRRPGLARAITLTAAGRALAGERRAAEPLPAA